MSTFTIEQIRNYIKSKDSLGDVLYYLTEENILKANTKEVWDNPISMDILYDLFVDDCIGTGVINKNLTIEHNDKSYEFDMSEFSDLCDRFGRKNDNIYEVIQNFNEMIERKILIEI